MALLAYGTDGGWEGSAADEDVRSELPKSIVLVRSKPSSAAISDDDLVARLAFGDTEALETLYRRHAAAIRDVAAAVLDARDCAAAEDVAQDVFVNLGERIADYRSEQGSVGEWLLALTLKLATERARRHARTAGRPLETALESPADETRSPERWAEWTMTHPRIVRAIEQLTADQRHTLETMFFEGLSFAEVAERDGTPIGTVKSRAARALAALREELKDSGPRRRRRRARTSNGNGSAPRSSGVAFTGPASDPSPETPRLEHLAD